jgi:hypothetical protein
MAKPLVPIVEEVVTLLIKKKGMHIVPTNVEMEKGKV